MSAGLEQLAEAIRQRSGMTLGPTRMTALAAALHRVAPGVEIEQLLGPLATDTAGPPLLDLLIDEMTVNETFFFRHRQDLDTIDWTGLAEVAARAGRRQVRVWSAACSTGEEAYSLAILASEAFGTRHPPVSVLGTDISPTVLERARAGRYGLRAVAAVDPDLRRRYFEEDGGRHRVDDRLRALVDFRRHNLTRDPSPPPGEHWFDLILCRNVLIYFDTQAVDATIRSLEGALEVGGTLILGSADRLCGAPRAASPGMAPRARPRLGTADGQRPAPGGRSRSNGRREAAAEPRRLPTGRRRQPARPTQGGHAPVGRAGGALAGEALRPAPVSSPVEHRPVGEGPLGADDPLAADPLDPVAYFDCGVAELERGEPELAIVSLRRALYLEPAFPLAAFQLGRAHEARGHVAAARRAYGQALRALEAVGQEPGRLGGEVDPEDVAAASRARLAALSRADAALLGRAS